MSLGQEVSELIFLALLLLAVIKIQRNISPPSVLQSVHSRAQSSHPSYSILSLASWTKIYLASDLIKRLSRATELSIPSNISKVSILHWELAFMATLVLPYLTAESIQRWIQSLQFQAFCLELMLDTTSLVWPESENISSSNIIACFTLGMHRLTSKEYTKFTQMIIKHFW